jgi:hypothetical protein
MHARSPSAPSPAQPHCNGFILVPLSVSLFSRAFTSSLETAVKDNTPLHMVPTDPNFPAVDSILYDPMAPLTPIQIIRRRKHPRVFNVFKEGSSRGPILQHFGRQYQERTGASYLLR